MVINGKKYENVVIDVIKTEKLAGPSGPRYVNTYQATIFEKGKPKIKKSVDLGALMQWIAASPKVKTVAT